MVKNMDCRVELLGLKSGFCSLPVPQFPHLRNGCNGAVVRFEEVLSTEADTQYLKYIIFFNPNFLLLISVPNNIMNKFPLS